MHSDVAACGDADAAESAFLPRFFAAKRGLFYALVFLAAFLIIFSRRPDAILNAQFFAEDGQRWYADAYQFGLRCLLIPDEAGGYLHTMPRLAALLALLFPFRRAPLVMNLCGIVVQALPAVLVFSSRFSFVPFWIRLLGSFMYLGLPNSYGTNVNVTNIQWHLALLAFLVLVAERANHRRWRFFDGLTLVLISVESPMGILLVPVAAILWWLRRSHYALGLFGLMVPGALLQCLVVLTSHVRQAAPNGATFAGLVTILGRQVFLASLLGKDKVMHIALRYSAPSSFALEAAATALGLIALAYAAGRAPVELKLFIAFSFAVLALALIRPLAGAPGQPQWKWLCSPGTSNRYFYFPILAFFSALLWIAARARPRAIRYGGAALLVLCFVGVRRDWRYPAFEDMHFGEYASKFEAAPSGTEMVIPLNPAPWKMELTKR